MMTQTRTLPISADATTVRMTSFALAVTVLLIAIGCETPPPPPPPPRAVRVPHGYAVPAPSPADIKALAKAGISDEVIISQIKNTRVVYRLTTAEILDLKDAGVSQKVIDFMINTASASP